jgi:hypothetical protein
MSAHLAPEINRHHPFTLSISNRMVRKESYTPPITRQIICDSQNVGK